MQKGGNWKHMPVSLWLRAPGFYFWSVFMKNTNMPEQYAFEWMLSLFVCLFKVCLSLRWL